MTTGKKLRSLVVAITFLFITNIVLLLFLFFGNNGNSTRTIHDDRTLVESFLQDSIGFDKQQMSAYKSLKSEDLKTRNPIVVSMKAARNNFYQNIYVDSVSDAVISNAALDFGAKQIAVDKHMLKYFKNLRRICSPAQLPKFDSSFRYVVEKVTPGRFRKRNNH